MAKNVSEVDWTSEVHIHTTAMSGISSAEQRAAVLGTAEGRLAEARVAYVEARRNTAGLRPDARERAIAPARAEYWAAVSEVKRLRAA